MTDCERLVRGIHAAPPRAVLAVTGGGSLALSQLLTVPGASRTVLSALVPYAAAALVEFLGARPEQFCSQRTARAMAMAAYQRAVKLRSAASDHDYPVLGIACTASLASEPPKHGPHRFHVAWQSCDTTVCRSVTLFKGRRTRFEEEQVAAHVILNVLAEASGVADRVSTGLGDDEPLVEQHATAQPLWKALLAGERQRVYIDHGTTTNEEPPVRAIFPGAFNPVHHGHRRIAQYAAARLQTPVHFELSILNVDKPSIDYWELRQRAAALADQVLWLTRAPTFVSKAMLFPGATFVVGADTITRIAEPRYYGDSQENRDVAINALVASGCRFLVFGRTVNGKFESLDDLTLPAALRAICDGVSESEFRDDVSSTELRRASGE